jgi:hypothetical protein
VNILLNVLRFGAVLALCSAGTISLAKGGTVSPAIAGTTSVIGQPIESQSLLGDLKLPSLSNPLANANAPVSSYTLWLKEKGITEIVEADRLHVPEYGVSTILGDYHIWIDKQNPKKIVVIK